MIALGFAVLANQNNVDALFSVVDFYSLGFAVLDQLEAVTGVYLLEGNG
ncbi:unannotated protein [freshwater metagenome]|uniref:Unannotated protein n=1 Tax=freshwater metagenome TaxID=449393 RepID=A0A6J6HU39_9ZZZZ